MKKDVVLLFGGNSEERLVSVASAQNLASQFSFSSLVFQSPSEELFVVDLSELQSHREVFVSDFKPRTAPFASNLEGAINFFKDKIIFMGFHGSQGENGQVQELFEKHRICFTGSGSKASHLAFEKNLGKEFFRSKHVTNGSELEWSLGLVLRTVM